MDVYHREELTEFTSPVVTPVEVGDAVTRSVVSAVVVLAAVGGGELGTSTETGAERDEH